jgi:hypothetical protein
VGWGAGAGGAVAATFLEHPAITIDKAAVAITAASRKFFISNLQYDFYRPSSNKAILFGQDFARPRACLH